MPGSRRPEWALSTFSAPSIAGSTTRGCSPSSMCCLRIATTHGSPAGGASPRNSYGPPRGLRPEIEPSIFRDSQPNHDRVPDCQGDQDRGTGRGPAHRLIRDEEDEGDYGEGIGPELPSPQEKHEGDLYYPVGQQIEEPEVLSIDGVALARREHEIRDKVLRIFRQLVSREEPDDPPQEFGIHEPDQNSRRDLEGCVEAFQQYPNLETGVQHAPSLGYTCALAHFGHVRLLDPGIRPTMANRRAL